MKEVSANKAPRDAASDEALDLECSAVDVPEPPPRDHADDALLNADLEKARRPRFLQTRCFSSLDCAGCRLFFAMGLGAEVATEVVDTAEMDLPKRVSINRGQ